MTATIGMITFDTSDPGPLASWWAERTGGRIEQENEGWFFIVSLPQGIRLGFQKVPDPTPGKNRVHIDLVTADVDAEVERFTRAGAKEVHREDMGEDFRWVTLADPDGNLFCVSSEH
ncbi:VOC family protein [Rhodococcus sp. NPDC047139]|uniref:VOC family protein n=1 Tax=Rhodococcus sp. NPDC047139 TaxID=3155141 RepID=UPI0033C6CE2A